MSNGDEREGAEIDALWSRWLGPSAVLVVLAGAAFVWWRVGPPAVVLWLAFAALTGAVLLFWEALRTVLDPAAQGDASPAEALALEDAELRARKKAALRALKDLEFEHSIRRLSDADHADLREKYRADARAAMEALDRGLGAYLGKAEALAEAELGSGEGEALAAPVASEASEASVASVASEASKSKSESESEVVREEAAEPAPAEEKALEMSQRICAKCETKNDPDATFCKRCGTKMEAA